MGKHDLHVDDLLGDNTISPDKIEVITVQRRNSEGSEQLTHAENQRVSKKISNNSCDSSAARDSGGGSEIGNSEGEEPPVAVPRPPDGGWGWMVALGSFVIATLIPTMGPCFGILFSPYLLSLGTSSTTTAWIFNAQCFIWNVMGLVTRSLTQEFGWRRVAFVGVALCWVAFVTSAFTPSAEFLFFSFSVLTGIGGGAAVCICFTLGPQYFDRHRGVANAIMMAGICAGQIVAPPFMKYLQDEYGFRGATFILGAILLNGCVGAMLFHPVEWHMKYPQREKDGESLLISSSSTEKNVIRSDSGVSLEGSLKGEEPDWNNLRTRAKMLRQRNGRHLSEVSNSSIALSTLDIAGLAAVQTNDTQAEILEEQAQDGKRSMWSTLSRLMSSVLSDLRVLRSPRALIIAAGGMLSINGYLNFVMMVPFAMQAAGHSLESSAWCISVAAIANLLFRMLMSSLSDWPRFNMKACYMAGYAMIAITTFVFPLLSDPVWILVDMAIWGCSVGTNMGLYNLVMIKIMGLENLASVFGACCSSVAVGFICIGPLIGVIRDASESYLTSMWVTGSMSGTSFLLWLFLMPAAQRYDQRRLRAAEDEGRQRDSGRRDQEKGC